MAFYNTTQETSSLLRKHELKAESQERKVMGLFRVSKQGMTASEVFRRYPERNVPLTSLRRAITNLVNERLLVKTQAKREGMYGRNEFVYELYTGQGKLF